MQKNGFIANCSKFLLRGLFFTAPIFITFYIIIASLQWLDRLIPFDIPGLGLLIIFVSIMLLGALASTFLAKPILDFFENLILRIPLANVIYSSIKDVVSAFVGDNKKFQNPVFVQLSNENNLKRIGFITEKNLEKLGKPNLVAVYIPDSFGITGNLYFTSIENIEYIDLPVAEVMRFIISGGITGSKKSTLE
jgi:uncharacterized membrane protein